MHYVRNHGMGIFWILLFVASLNFSSTFSNEDTLERYKRGLSQRRIDDGGGSLFSFAVPFLQTLGLPKTSEYRSVSLMGMLNKSGHGFSKHVIEPFKNSFNTYVIPSVQSGISAIRNNAFSKGLNQRVNHMLTLPYFGLTNSSSPLSTDNSTTNQIEPWTFKNSAIAMSRNILGDKVTDTNLLPRAAILGRGVSSIEKGFKLIGDALFAVELSGSGLQIKSEPKSNPRSEEVAGRITSAPRCTTPKKESGKCLDIQDCPLILADFTTLRKSICFKAGFIPGVCCPDKGLSLLDLGSSESDQQGDKVESNEVNSGNTSDKKGSSTTPASPIDVAPECGVSQRPQSRIVGGKATYEGEYPWMVAIYLHGGGHTEFWCGGALVSERHVITAAHCTKDAKKKQFKARQFTIKLGEWDLDDKDTYSQEYEIMDVIAHPDFRANGFYNDIAIMKTIKPVTFSEYIQPICLPSGPLRSNDFLGTLPVALGWGATHYRGKEVSRLRGVPLPVWNNKDCDSAYFQPITEVFLCAGYASGGKDACQGDSGGPLMLYSHEKKAWVLIGVVSFGNRCAEAGYPGVYTRITHFMDWVDLNLN